MELLGKEYITQDVRVWLERNPDVVFNDNEDRTKCCLLAKFFSDQTKNPYAVGSFTIESLDSIPIEGQLDKDFIKLRIWFDRKFGSHYTVTAAEVYTRAKKQNIF